MNDDLEITIAKGIHLHYKKFMHDLRIVILSGALGITLSLIGLDHFMPYDSTDYVDEGERSGMTIKIDAKTGCHYLNSNGLTPRLNKDGTQICTGKEE